MNLIGLIFNGLHIARFNLLQKLRIGGLFVAHLAETVAEDGENEQEYKGNHHKIHNGLSIPVLLITVVVIIVIISVLPIIRFERISIFVVIRSLVFHLVLRILSLATYSSLII